MPQTREDRIIAYLRALKRHPRHREYRQSHYEKGYYLSPEMMVARLFEVPVRTVREIISARRAETTVKEGRHEQA